MNPSVKLITIIFILSGLANASLPRCDALASADSRQLIQYLKDGSAESSDPHCLEYALRRLGSEKVGGSASALASYLGFHRPETEREAMGMGGQLATPGNEFPAVWALAQIGKPALPSLAHAIETETSSSQASQNAVYATVLIFSRGAGAVDFLRGAAAATKSKESRQRLLEAAKRASAWCQPSERSACQSALSEASK